MPNYQEIARQIAIKQGIDPNYFTNQIRAESNFNPTARSGAGAIGIAQIVPKWHPGVDPMDPMASLRYAAKWDADLLRKYGGDWRKVLSTYNSGQPDKWSDPNFSGGQTYNYVNKILGAGYKPGAGGVPTAAAPVPSAATLPTMGPPMPAASGGFGLSNLTNALVGSLGKSPGDQLSSVLGALTAPQPMASPAPSLDMPLTPQLPSTGLPTAGPLGGQGPVAPGKPVAFKGQLIGTPGAGTHSWSEGPQNWESDNAIDVPLPYGTPIRAVADGVIGDRFGPLDSSDPRMAGLRLHLNTKGNEYYYAHLSRFVPGLKPGSRVKAGQIIGFSGAANGVNHLHFGQERGNPARMYG